VIAGRALNRGSKVHTWPMDEKPRYADLPESIPISETTELQVVEEAPHDGPSGDADGD
jgi:hypothetical protein